MILFESRLSRAGSEISEPGGRRGLVPPEASGNWGFFSLFASGYKLRAIPELPAGETQSLRFEARIRPWPTLLRDLRCPGSSP